MRGDPFLVQRYQLPGGPDHDVLQFIRIHDGNTKSPAGLMQPLGIHAGAKYAHFGVDPAKCLVAVKHGLTVMQHRNPRFQGNRLIGLNLRIKPFAVRVSHAEHMVAKNRAETEVVEVNLGNAALLGGSDRKGGWLH